jgi:hypothetical protein
MKLTIALIVLFLVIMASRKPLLKFLRPDSTSPNRRCPHCGHEFEGTRRYCIACGGQIWDDVLGRE